MFPATKTLSDRPKLSSDIVTSIENMLGQFARLVDPEVTMPQDVALAWTYLDALCQWYRSLN